LIGGRLQLLGEFANSSAQFGWPKFGEVAEDLQHLAAHLKDLLDVLCEPASGAVLVPIDGDIGVANIAGEHLCDLAGLVALAVKRTDLVAHFGATVGLASHKTILAQGEADER